MMPRSADVDCPSIAYPAVPACRGRHLFQCFSVITSYSIHYPKLYDSLAWSPAIFAIRMGPPSVLAGMTRMTSFITVSTVRRMIFPVSSAARPMAATGPILRWKTSVLATTPILGPSTFSPKMVRPSRTSGRTVRNNFV